MHPAIVLPTTIQPGYVAAGFIVGALVGITGVGGGSLMTPILILFGIHPSVAVGTDLLYASVTKSGGTVVHGLNRTIDWKIVGRLLLGSIPATILTLIALYFLHAGSPAAQIVVTRVLGVALFLTAIALIIRKPLVNLYARRIGELDPSLVRKLTIANGALLGVLVPISSVGAGAIGATFLILLYPKCPIRRIVGSDIAHAVPLTLVAGLGHLAMGSINWPLLITLLLGSLPGITVGSYFSARLPDSAVRLTLAGVLLLVCARMLVY